MQAVLRRGALVGSHVCVGFLGCPFYREYTRCWGGPRSGDVKDGAQAAFRHDRLPVVAKTYYLQMLTAKLDTRRNKREVYTLCTVLDHLCLGEYELSYKFMDALSFSPYFLFILVHSLLFSSSRSVSPLSRVAWWSV